MHTNKGHIKNMGKWEHAICHHIVFPDILRKGEDWWNISFGWNVFSGKNDIGESLYMHQPKQGFYPE